MLKTVQNGNQQNAQAARASQSTLLHSARPAQVEGHVARMQHAFGNQRLLRLANGDMLQRKLTINQPGDAFEQEADRVADTVMRMADPASTSAVPQEASSGSGNLVLQRCSCGASSSSGGECEECKAKALNEEKTLQRSAEAPSAATEAPPIVHDVLGSHGQPLNSATRAFMEPRFGADFSNVRVHTDAKAAESAKAVNALAYTVGNNVVFGQGRFSPQTEAGQKLLAHELAHTVQQTPMSLKRQGSGIQTKACSPPADLPCTVDTTPAGPEKSESILFGPSSAKVPPLIEKRIPGFVESVLEDKPNSIFKVDGYASLDGDCNFNWKLSCDRANAVAKDLAAAGASSITIAAHGPTDEFSTVPGDGDSNRRATITVQEPCPNSSVNTDQDSLPPVPAFNPKILPASEVFNRVKQMLAPGQPVPENPPLGASQPSFTNNPVKVSAIPVPDSDCMKCVAEWDLSATFESLISSPGPVDFNEPKIFEAFQQGSQEGCPFHALPVLLPVKRLILPAEVPFTIAAEREHFNDFVEAFRIVGGRYIANIRRLTPERSHVRGQNQAECQDKVTDFLFDTRGGLPFLTPFLPRFSENFANDFTKLFLLPDRDRPGGPHFANPFPSFRPFKMPIRPNIDRDKNPFGCNAFFRKYNGTGNPGIPGPPSASIIKDTARPQKQPWHVL